METITAFGDSIVKGVIYENSKYKVTDGSFHRICEETLGIVIDNKAKFGSTISRGEKVFQRSLDLISKSDSKYVVLGFGGNDCDYNWKEISEAPFKKQ